jgi:chemotaxis protein MotA
VFAIIGTVVMLGSVLGGFMMGGSSLLLLWHPLEVVVICGAALGAFMTSNPLKVVKASFGGAIGLLKGPRYGGGLRRLLKLVYDILVKSRKEGVLAIEADIEDPSKSDIFKKYPVILADHHMIEFITDCLRLMVGRQPGSARAREPARVRARDAPQGSGRARACRAEGGRRAARLRHRGRRARHREHHGLDRRREHREIGHKVGAALVGTFLGILVAYGFVGPIAAAMEPRARGRQGLRGREDGAGGQRARLSAAGRRGVRAQAAVQRHPSERSRTWNRATSRQEARWLR